MPAEQPKRSNSGFVQRINIFHRNHIRVGRHGNGYCELNDYLYLNARITSKVYDTLYIQIYQLYSKVEVDFTQSVNYCAYTLHGKATVL